MRPTHGDIKNLPRSNEFADDDVYSVQRAGLNAGSSIGNGILMRKIIEHSNSQRLAPSDGLAVTLERLADLSVAEEEFPLPTSYACQLATHVLRASYKYLQGVFPRATVSVEENGGLFVYWIKSSCTVQLTVPSSLGGFFYIRVMKNGAPSQVYQDATGERLARCLRTFNLMN